MARAIFAIAALAAVLAVASASDRTEARWCVTQQAEYDFCKENLDMFNSAQEQVDFSCYLANGTDCVAAIADGQADFTRVGGFDTYQAWKQHGMDAVAHFDNAYKAVAIVNKEMCEENPDLTFSDFKGKSMCSTGYRKTAGWVVPTGLLLGRGIMDYVPAQQAADLTASSVAPGVTVQADAASVAAFYGDVCAARTSGDGPAFDTETGNATKWDDLCGACSGDCSTEEPLYDYEGALRGLMEGKCDVAFTKDTIIPEFVKGGEKEAEWSTMEASDLRVVCKDGGCKEVSEADSCNLATSPAHTIVTAGNYSAKNDLRSAFVSLFESDDFRSAVLSADNNPENLLMSSSITAVEPVYSVPRHLGDIKELFDAYTLAITPEAHADDDGALPVVRFCVAKEEEAEFCEQTLPVMNSAQDHANFTCVLSSDCTKAVADGEADVMRTGSFDIYNAWVSYGIEPIFELDGAYEAIVAVNKSMCDANPEMKLADLKGLNLCSTGFRRTAGWVIPAGYMLAYDIMPLVKDEANVTFDAQSVASFFGDVCAARTSVDGPAIDPKTGNATLWPELCGACADDCSTNEPLFDYEGALRGLMEGKCDVAFTKSTVLAEYAKGGEKEAEWSSLAADDMRVVCREGGCKGIDETGECKIATVPGHAVSTRGEFPHKTAVRAAFKEMIEDEDFKSAVLSAENNPEGYVLKNDVTVGEDVFSAVDYLGDIIEAYDGYDMLHQA